MLKIIFKSKIKNICIILLIILIILLNLTSIYIFGEMVKNVVSGNHISKLLIVFIVVKLIEQLVLTVQNFLEINIKKHILITIRNKLIQPLKSVSSMDIDNNLEKGYFNQQINDVNTFEETYLSSFYSLIYNVIFFILGTIFMFILFYPLAITLLIASILSIIVVKIRNDKIKINSKNYSDDNKKYVNTVINTIDGKLEIKLNNAVEYFNEKLNKASKKIANKTRKFKNKNYLIYTLASLPTFIIVMITLGISLYGMYKGIITVEIFAIYLTINGYILSSGNNITQCLVGLKVGKSIITLNEKGEKDLVNIGTGDLMIRNINKVNGELKTRAINIKFEFGKKYLITGKSGSGKSTLLKILVKEIKELDYKNVSINNRKYEELDDKSLYNNIGYMSQETYIFNNSIYFNIFFNDDVEEKEIINVLRFCELEEVVNNKGGIYSFISSEDNNLSGGEKQRIMLARLIHAKKKYFLLDEPFSNLDKSNKMKILKRIIDENVTLIMVSHDSELDQELFDKVIELKK